MFALYAAVAYGYLFLHRLLKNEGLVVNKKQTYRIYTEEGLQVRTKKRKNLQRPRQPMVVPVERNQRWSMDFVSDQLSNGRRFRVLNLIDDYSREVIDQLVSFSISGQQVARFLEQATKTRGRSAAIVCDNGTGRCQANGIHLSRLNFKSRHTSAMS